MMQTWACGHEGEEGHSRLCPHFIGAKLDTALYFRVLRGKALEADFCCRECGERLKVGEALEWLFACEACVEQIEENEGDILGWIGSPEIKERNVAFDSALSSIVLLDEAARADAMVPLDSKRFIGYWDSSLFVVEPESIRFVCPAPLPPEEHKAWKGHHLAPRLYVSPDERFVVVCHDYGRFGHVFDLRDERATMQLDRGTYHPQTQPFSVSFFQKETRSLLVHAVNWNRLEISEPQNGELLTPRDALMFEGQESPEHYLDFFHGALIVSPDEQWIADDGWVWHPVGELAVWNLEEWLGDNVYESEDGASRRMLCWRDNLWDIPIAWIDNERLAVWGIGREASAMLNGARIFDVSTGKETATFAGPGKNAFFGGEGHLFSVEDDDLHIWDASSGERLGRINGFKPQWQRGDFLIELTGNMSRAWEWRTAFE